MKTSNYFMAIFVAGTSILFSCGENQTKTENTPVEQKNEQIVYQCPMKCEGEKIYDKPGACPVCKMDLEKVEHHDHQH